MIASPRKPSNVKAVIRPTVLMGSRIYPDRKSYHVSERTIVVKETRKVIKQAIADHLIHRQVIGKGISHVSLEKPGDPVEVLLPDGAVETILRLKEM